MITKMNAALVSIFFQITCTHSQQLQSFVVDQDLPLLVTSVLVAVC